MPLQIQLTGTGPGQGFFDISGDRLAGESVELAIQRSSDDGYLGENLVWQSTPHWHVGHPVEVSPGRLRLSAGAEIVDGIAGSSVNALRMLVRIDGTQDYGVLRIRALVGSQAATPPAPPAEPSRPAPPYPAARPTAQTAPQEPPGGPPPVRRRILVISMLLAALILAVGFGAWYAGLLEHWLAPHEPETARAETEPPRSIDAPRPAKPREGGPVEPQEAQARAPFSTGPTGLKLVQQILREGPSAQVMYDRALDRERAGDCEAAILLYTRAASADAAIAAEVARRYDPEGFEGSDCIESPNRENALVWYEDAARTGDLVAQRRLGAMLIEGVDSGITHEQGIDWLRKAAASGDQRALQILERER